MFKHIATLLIALILSGCALFEEVDTPTGRLAFEYATLKVIDGQTDRAQRVTDLMNEAQRYINSDAEITIERLAQEARERIDWQSLDPADQLLIDAVLARAEARLKERIGDGLLDKGQRVKLQKALSWIEEAARGYASDPTAH